MPQLLSSPFTSYDFTPEELMVCATFTDGQVQWLHTQIHNVVIEQIGLQPTGLDDREFMLKRENLIGRQQALEGLLAYANTLMKDAIDRRMSAMGSEPVFKDRS